MSAQLHFCLAMCDFENCFRTAIENWKNGMRVALMARTCFNVVRETKVPCARCAKETCFKDGGFRMYDYGETGVDGFLDGGMACAECALSDEGEILSHEDQDFVICKRCFDNGTPTIFHTMGHCHDCEDEEFCGIDETYYFNDIYLEADGVVVPIDPDWEHDDWRASKRIDTLPNWRQSLSVYN
jgi:hypothetical protein